MAISSAREWSGSYFPLPSTVEVSVLNTGGVVISAGDLFNTTTVSCVDSMPIDPSAYTSLAASAASVAPSTSTCATPCKVSLKLAIGADVPTVSDEWEVTKDLWSSSCLGTASGATSTGPSS